MSKPAKNSNINIRISDADKLKYAQEAKNFGMDLSKYIMYLLEHKEVRIIEGGKELAHAIYELNSTLNKCVDYPSMPMTKIREAVSNNVEKLNNFIMREREADVDTKI